MKPRECLRVDNAIVLQAAPSGNVEKASICVVDGLFATERQLSAAVASGAGLVQIDGTGKLLVPGFVNAHTHSPLNVLKGTGDILSHPAFMWLNQADTAGRSREEIELSTLLGCIEHLLCGTTAVIDHFPEQGFDLADVDAVAGAYEKAGLRALVALRIFDEPYADILPPGGLSGGLATANPLEPPPLERSLELVEQAISAHHGSAGGRLTIAPGPSNPMRCSDALLERVREMSEDRNTPVHIHLLETEVQTRIARERYGTTMIRHLDRLGVLGARLSCAHTIWIGEDDIALMAERGAIVIHNPESNCKIGAGIAPISKMLKAGVTVALGTDGASTNDNLDLHETMRFAAILQRPLEPDRALWPSARDVVRMATIAGGKAMLCEGLGMLQPGAPADFVLHDLADPSWIPLNDPLHQLVFTATGSTVHTVVVAGHILVRERKIVSFDAEPVLREAHGIVERMRRRNPALHAMASDLARKV